MTPWEALRGAAALGPYFVWEPWEAGHGWRPLSELLDADVVAERVGVARQTLVRMSGLGVDEIGEREVASIMFLGWASRLVSPLVGAVATTGVLPRAEIGQLWWRPVEGGPLPVAYDRVAAADKADLDVVKALLQVVSKRFSLPEHLLWGNVASALGGAAGMIADSAPEHAASAAAAVEQLLGQAPLKNTAVLEQPDPETERWFLVRRNCCLYYRIPGGGKCGDCVLTPEAVRRQHWQAVLRNRRRS
ncbi:(2Fe-2S)-binding protein [Actinoplanes sp. CA-142083]|uniref:(2Fe-2S)-binding protein n=1 Tax=Actinoplanes sp. CA-142083 TaxID=3239903 RepID=UPI003D8F6A8E